MAYYASCPHTTKSRVGLAHAGYSPRWERNPSKRFVVDWEAKFKLKCRRLMHLSMVKLSQLLLKELAFERNVHALP